ncbi:leucine--tRNA ligase, partial [bacterium]|nr:leucine--tRNA ligase [bacterium]
VHQGMILGTNGIKMGKRYPEYAIDPLDIVKNYGADTLRLYEMFMGPLEASKPWNNNGVEGAQKFLDRVYRLYESDKITNKENKNLEKIYHQTVKKVTEDFESLSFNTAISQMMIFINAVYKEDVFPVEYAEGFIKLLNPIAPHITEEIWEKLGHKETMTYEKWPEYQEDKLKDDIVTVVVQVNGKVRGKMEVVSSISNEEMETKAFNIDNVKQYTLNKEVVKVITIPKKLVNIVIK